MRFSPPIGRAVSSVFKVIGQGSMTPASVSAATALAVEFRNLGDGHRRSFDPAERDKTLAEQGLDFAEAATVFAGVKLTLQDDRRNCGEPRFQGYGLLDQRLVMVAWRPRGADRHVISMRKCNAREKARFEARLG